MTELLVFLKEHKYELNLADISRKAGYDATYLKHIVSGRRSLTPQSASRIRPVLDLIVEKYPKTGDK